MKFTCSYIYPRVEEFEVRRIANSGGGALVVGLRGSGVSTLLDRISRFSERKPTVIDMDNVWEALDYALKHRDTIVGATGSLRELLELLVKAPSDLRVVVVKPLMLRELEEYLSHVGVMVTRRELLRELHFRTGGMPGEVCKLIVERNLIGKSLTDSDLEVLPSEPGWIREARSVMGSDFDKLMLHTTLALIPGELSLEAGVEGSWWLLRGDDGYYRVHPDILWLQGFSLRLVDRLKATRLLEASLNVDRDDLARYTHLTILYKLTGVRDYAREAVLIALRIIDGFEDPVTRYNLSLSTLELAETTGPPEAYIKLLKVLVENTPLTEFMEARDLAGILSKAKRWVVGVEPLRAYIDLLQAIALRLSIQRLIREIDMVLSELEDITIRLDIPSDVRRYAEKVYLKTLAIKSANLGEWREVLRVSVEALERGGFDSQIISLLALSLCFRGLRDQMSMKALKLLESHAGEDRMFTETLLTFCSAESIEDMRRVARIKPEEERDQRLTIVRLLAQIASRTPVSEDYIDRVIAQKPQQTIVKALLATVKGDSGRLINMIKELPGTDDPSNPISLVLDILVNVSMAIKRSSDMKRLAPHITILADSLKAGRLEELSDIVHRIASRLRDGDSDGLRVELSKLVFYTLNTFY